MESSNFLSNTDDVQSICSKDKDDNISSGKKSKTIQKKLPSSTKAACRKSPRGLGPKIASRGDEDYNEEENDMDIDEEKKEEEDSKREESVAKKQRRSKEEDVPSEGKLDFGLEITTIPLSPIPPQE